MEIAANNAALQKDKPIYPPGPKIDANTEKLAVAAAKAKAEKAKKDAEKKKKEAESAKKEMAMKKRREEAEKAKENAATQAEMVAAKEAAHGPDHSDKKQSTSYLLANPTPLTKVEIAHGEQRAKAK